MPRPIKKRNICLKIKNFYFGPIDRIKEEDSYPLIEVDELEAIRLADLQDNYHDLAAKKMGISRATFGKLLKQGHKKIATAIILGQPIVINCPQLRNSNAGRKS